MKTGRMLTLGAAAALLAALPLATNAVEAKTKAHKGYTGQRYARGAQNGCPLRRTVDGDLVDCRGWRFRPNVGWDNTCLNVDYLPSMYACSSPGRR